MNPHAEDKPERLPDFFGDNMRRLDLLKKELFKFLFLILFVMLRNNCIHQYFFLLVLLVKEDTFPQLQQKTL